VGVVVVRTIYFDDATKPTPAAAAAAAAADKGDKGSSSSSGGAKPAGLKTRAVAGANGERLEPVVESPLAGVNPGASPFGQQEVQRSAGEGKKGR
jgi:hypothetical protein